MSIIEFQSKWSELEKLLFGFALKLTKDKEDARDLMQETGLKAFKYRSRYQMNTNFKAWTTTIMRNTFINIYHKRRTRNQVEAPVEDLLYALESRNGRETADSIVRMNDLKKLISGISTTYRIPFLMAFEGYEYKEIADTLEIPVGTVKSRIHSARQNLRKAIRKHYLNIN